jgi:hypothetical protein
LGDRIRQVVAPVEHGYVLLRDAESTEAHVGWDPDTALVSYAPDSILFSVRRSADGEVALEIFRGIPDRPLDNRLLAGEIYLAHGRIVLHDPNDDFRVEVPGLGHGGPLSILVDEIDLPAKVQIVLEF